MIQRMEGYKFMFLNGTVSLLNFGFFLTVKSSPKICLILGVLFWGDVKSVLPWNEFVGSKQIFVYQSSTSVTPPPTPQLWGKFSKFGTFKISVTRISTNSYGEYKFINGKYVKMVNH